MHWQALCVFLTLLGRGLLAGVVIALRCSFLRLRASCVPHIVRTLLPPVAAHLRQGLDPLDQVDHLQVRVVAPSAVIVRRKTLPVPGFLMCPSPFPLI